MHDPLCVDPAWFGAVVSRTQQAIGQVCTDHAPEAIRAALTDLAEHLPPAGSPVERLLLRCLMRDLVWQCGMTLQASAHVATGPGRCDVCDDASRPPRWERLDLDPRGLLTGWASRQVQAFLKRHPPSAAQRAAALLRDGYVRPWTLASLAGAIHSPVAYLRDEFQQQYGMSIRAYQQRVRILAALPLLRAEKTESVALQVGFHSRKNFYRALQRTTGHTPTSFRRLSPDGVAAIVDRLANRLRFSR